MQDTPHSKPSTLATGGGAALIDPADTLVLLLDHQSGHRLGARRQQRSVDSVARFVQGGVKPTSANALLSELHRTWARPEAAELAKLYGLVAPNYAAVAESYARAQQAVRDAA
nr:hypothetical protein [uncultured Duganella sp.]